jgi:hypothetical protein
MFASLRIGLFLSDQVKLWYTYALGVSIGTAKISDGLVALNKVYAIFCELRLINSHFSQKMENEFSTNLCKITNDTWS